MHTSETRHKPYDINTQVKLVISFSVLYDYLREYQKTDEIFMIYEHENIATNNTEQQMTQCNNICLSFRSYIAKCK